MRRLLQCGTLLFLLVIVIAPLSELFDRWDAPGLTNDAEFSVFVLAFVLCLLLVLMQLVSAAATRIPFAVERLRIDDLSDSPPSFARSEFPVLPVSPPPLRI